MLAGWYYKGRRGPLQDTLTGAVSGFMTAIAGIGGPPIILYLLSIPSLSPSVLRSVCLVYFSLAQVATLTPLAIGGKLSVEHVVYVAILLPVSVLASRSEEHTSELQSLMRISYAVFFLKKKKQHI